MAWAHPPDRPRSQLALHAVYATFADSRSDNGVDDELLLSQSGFTAFVRACPGLLTDVFTEEDAVAVFDRAAAASNGSATGGAASPAPVARQLDFNTFHEALQQMAVLRYAGGEEGMGLRLAKLLSLHVFKIPNLNLTEQRSRVVPHPAARGRETLAAPAPPPAPPPAEPDARVAELEMALECAREDVNTADAAAEALRQQLAAVRPRPVTSSTSTSTEPMLMRDMIKRSIYGVPWWLLAVGLLIASILTSPVSQPALLHPHAFLRLVTWSWTHTQSPLQHVANVTGDGSVQLFGASIPVHVNSTWVNTHPCEEYYVVPTPAPTPVPTAVPTPEPTPTPDPRMLPRGRAFMD